MTWALHGAELLTTSKSPVMPVPTTRSKENVPYNPTRLAITPFYDGAILVNKEPAAWMNFLPTTSQTASPGSLAN